MNLILRVAGVPQIDDTHRDTIARAIKTWAVALRIARSATTDKTNANRKQTYRFDIYTKRGHYDAKPMHIWMQSIIVKNIIDHDMWPAHAPTTDFVFTWHDAYNDDEYVDISIEDVEQSEADTDGYAPTLF